MSYEAEHQTVAHTTPAVSPPPAKPDSSFLEIIRFAAIALVIVLPIRWFVAQPFIVSGASMEHTFHDKEYLIVDQLTYRFTPPHRGDVIVFKYPNDHTKYFIKRVIGLPGDTVAIDDGKVSIRNADHPDGVTLAEPYAVGGTDDIKQTTTLGEHEYFVMGDNRDHSSDSRAWGTLQYDEIIGRVFLRLLPPHRIGLLPGMASEDNF